LPWWEQDKGVGEGEGVSLPAHTARWLCTPPLLALHDVLTGVLGAATDCCCMRRMRATSAGDCG